MKMFRGFFLICTLNDLLKSSVCKHIFDVFVYMTSICTLRLNRYDSPVVFPSSYLFCPLEFKFGGDSKRFLCHKVYNGTKRKQSHKIMTLFAWLFSQWKRTVFKCSSSLYSIQCAHDLKQWTDWIISYAVIRTNRMTMSRNGATKEKYSIYYIYEKNINIKLVFLSNVCFFLLVVQYWFNLHGCVINVFFSAIQMKNSDIH